MNEQRRRKIKKIIEDLENILEILNEYYYIESDAYDNLPYQFQDGEMGDRMNEAMDALDEARTSLEEVMDSLGSIV